MPQSGSFPRICIALGLPDVPTLLAHARREAEAGETFLEFRLDYLDRPCDGPDAIRRFLDQFPEVRRAGHLPGGIRTTANSTAAS